MRIIPMAALAAAASLSAGCATYAGAGDPWGRYDGYYDRYYTAGQYEPYALSRDDYIYRGSNGTYYCRRRDGTVGLVVGAGVGALLGNAIAPRGSNTIGTLLGAAAGAAIGSAIERGEVRCQ
ncbi:MAG: glycine zipper 2TM domain-containing protein [Alphaproteobacteria bacterium]|nr:MAG: glycine zipper 2TM domain-containing protein [Alphaproteobacteria bacterium]